MNSSVATKLQSRLDACESPLQLRDVARYLLKHISDFFSTQHIRVRTPAIFGTKSCIEIAWWPGTTILIYEDKIRCFDGKSPVPQITTDTLVYGKAIYYEWLQIQLKEQLVAFDEDTDAEEVEFSSMTNQD